MVNTVHQSVLQYCSSTVAVQPEVLCVVCGQSLVQSSECKCVEFIVKPDVFVFDSSHGVLKTSCCYF